MKFRSVIIIGLVAFLVAGILIGCEETYNKSVRKDRIVTDQQLQHYQTVQPVPVFDYSIPRDVLTQIYTILTIGAVSTYTVVTDDFGGVFYQGPSIGFPIPADVQLTNPLQAMHYDGAVVEQMEPNGLYSSKNTNATYVLWVQEDGSVAPGYYELRANAFMYPVVKTDKGWVKAEGASATTTIDMTRIRSSADAIGKQLGK